MMACHMPTWITRRSGRVSDHFLCFERESDWVHARDKMFAKRSRRQVGRKAMYGGDREVGTC